MVPVLAQFGVLSLYPCPSMSINGYENVSSKPPKILDREGYLGWTGDRGLNQWDKYYSQSFHAMETWITSSTQFIRSKMFMTEKKNQSQGFTYLKQWEHALNKEKKEILSNIVKETVVILPINHSKFFTQEIC